MLLSGINKPKKQLSPKMLTPVFLNHLLNFIPKCIVAVNLYAALFTKHALF